MFRRILQEEQEQRTQEHINKQVEGQIAAVHLVQEKCIDHPLHAGLVPDQGCSKLQRIMFGRKKKQKHDKQRQRAELDQLYLERLFFINQNREVREQKQRENKLRQELRNTIQ